MASAEREPITGVWGRAPAGSKGSRPPEAEKVLRFGHAMETANLPYNSLYFGNWVNRCYSWYLSKTEVQSLQWSPGAKQLCLRGQKLFVLNRLQYEGWRDTAGSKETEFTISLCVVPYRATRCIRYSGLLDNLLVSSYQNVTWKLLIVVQYTTWTS